MRVHYPLGERLPKELTLSLLLGLLTSSASAASLALTETEQIIAQEHLPFGFPSAGELIFRKGYIVSHDNWLKIPRWSAYHISSTTVRGWSQRTDDFRADQELKPWQRAELADYARSGYARGHMAPSAAMRRDKQTNSESFLLSNMVPQIGPGFNSGIWAHLEDKVREWALARGEGWVFVGPAFQETDNSGMMKFKLIGKSRVAVPTHNFMILVTRDRAGAMDAIAFMMPNEKAKNDKLPSFLTSIKEIERVTGLDFLDVLPDDEEDDLEARQPTTLWQ